MWQILILGAEKITALGPKRAKASHGLAAKSRRKK